MKKLNRAIFFEGGPVFCWNCTFQSETDQFGAEFSCSFRETPAAASRCKPCEDEFRRLRVRLGLAGLVPKIILRALFVTLRSEESSE